MPFFSDKINLTVSVVYGQRREIGIELSHVSYYRIRILEDVYVAFK